MPRPKPDLTIDTHVPELAWQLQGACRGLNPNIFFPEIAEAEEIPKKICAGCAVRAVCLEYALATRQEGVWGGCSERDRRRIAKARRAAAA